MTASGWLTGYEGYGNVVMVDAGGGYSVLYAHLSEAHVVPGQWLAAGDPIGEAGCTGSCTGTHLHFELQAERRPDRSRSLFEVGCTPHRSDGASGDRGYPAPLPMTRTLPLRSALVVLLASLVVAPVASARMDNAARLQMVWPANGTVTSPFGEWRGNHRHDGIDIGMLRTLRLRAVTEGVVRNGRLRGGYEGYGRSSCLDLPGPYTAIYAHLSRVAVQPGQHVRKGQRIGQAGCTGSCSGTHLHFEVERAGVPDQSDALPRLDSAPEGG